MDDARRTRVNELRHVLSTTGFDHIFGAHDIRLPVLEIGPPSSDTVLDMEYDVAVFGGAPNSRNIGDVTA